MRDLELFRDEILKCEKKCDEMTKSRKHENTEGTSDIGDYANSILDDFFAMTSFQKGAFLLNQQLN